jgi:uncharacterized protein YdaU (DUF1376 family)
VGGCLNHYPHHLGDYAKDTLGLSMMEHGAYRLLLDAYYASEEAPAKEDVYAIARAGNAAERKAVDKVLRKFELKDGRYYHKRVEQELQAFRERSAMAAEKANKRWKRHAEAHTEPHAEAMPRHNPGITGAMLASSHKPVENLDLVSSATVIAAGVPPPPPAARPAPLSEGLAQQLHGLAMGAMVREVRLIHAEQWVRDGHTEATVSAAIARARIRGKPQGTSIPIGFFQQMLLDVRAGVDQPYDAQGVIERAAARIAASEAKNATH